MRRYEMRLARCLMAICRYVSTNSGFSLAAVVFAIALAPGSGWAAQTQNCPTEPTQNVPIVSGVTFYGNNCVLNTTGDVDSFVFNASAGDTYAIGVGLAGSANANVCLSLYAPGVPAHLITSSCTNVPYSSGATAINQKVTASGAYTIIVTETGNAVQKYALSVERLNPVPPDAAPLVFSKNVVSGINAPTGYEAFTFYGDTTGTYEIAESIAGSATANICFTVFAPDGTTAVAGTCTNVPYSAPSISQQLTPTQNGTYVVVDYVAGDDGTVNFNLEVSCLLGTCVSPPPPSFQFVPVTPCRLVDTRDPNGPYGGPELAPNTSRSFDITHSPCNIPSTAAAYSLNVTVVPDAQLGFLTIWPTGDSQPLVSTLNSDGRIKANAAIVPAGSGPVSVFVTDSSHVILDIDGYFAPAGASSLEFHPVTPCRIADTRQVSGFAGPFGPPYLFGAVPSRSFPILSSSCNIPSSAQAYSLNFTAIPHGPLGFITVWPTGQPQPLVSTLNASTGAVTANAAMVPAGSGGAISVFAANDTDLVIDINGYFAPPGSGGLSLYTLIPCRVLDTRNPPGSPPFNGTIVTNVSANVAANPSCNPLGAGAQAFVLNATVVPPGPLGFLSLWPDSEPQPLVSTLNALDGAITSNMAIVPTVNLSIDSFVSNPSQLVLDISGYFAP